MSSRLQDELLRQGETLLAANLQAKCLIGGNTS